MVLPVSHNLWLPSLREERKISAQGQASVACGELELNSHAADTTTCGSNCIIMNFTGKECNVPPLTDACKAFKSVLTAQAATTHDNPKTGETSILTLHEATWIMGNKMDHILVNRDQLRVNGITAQDDPFAQAPIFIATEGNDFITPLTSKGTTLGVTTRTPTDEELQTCPHVLELSSECEWDSEKVFCPAWDFVRSSATCAKHTTQKQVQQRLDLDDTHIKTIQNSGAALHARNTPRRSKCSNALTWTTYTLRPYKTSKRKNLTRKGIDGAASTLG
jgi:hypothetical protein